MARRPRSPRSPLGRRDGRERRAPVAALAVLAAALLGAPSAHAHGRPAALGSLSAQPGAPGRLVAQGTWGLALRGAEGQPWRWLCAAVFGVDARSEDPSIVVMGDGAILAGTYGGLLRSEDGGCSWARPDEALGDTFIVDLHRIDARTVLAVASEPGVEDRLFRSADAGRTWQPLDRFGDVLVDRVRSAPSDPSRVYASGAIPGDGASPRRAFALSSDDGGASFTAFELPLEAGERLLHVWAVDPRDPDVLYGQVLHFNGEAAPERVVRSEDGGETFETVLRIPFVGGVLVTEAGVVYAGSRLGGLFRSLDGRAFEPVDETLPVTCLAEVGAVVWACVDQARAGHALARSVDGLRFEPVLRLSEIAEMAPCPRCSPAGIECPAWEVDVAYDLGLDASLPPGFDADASTGGPRDAALPDECRLDGGSGAAPAGCGCRVSGSEPAPGPLWVIAAALITAPRWRRGGRTKRNEDGRVRVGEGR